MKAGHADLVGMARALIADPDLPVKSQAGRLAEVRGCLGINQDCRAFDPHLHCAVNAEVGRGRLPASACPCRGPGRSTSSVVGRRGWRPPGSRRARSPGHPLRADRSLGGALRVAAAAPHRATLIDVVDHLAREGQRLRVDVNLGRRDLADDLEEIRTMADHVVLATGRGSPRAQPAPVRGRLPGRRGAAPSHAHPDVPGRHVVVYDEGDGFWPAYSAAEALLQQGWQVTFATPLTALASPGPRRERRTPAAPTRCPGGAVLHVAHALVVPEGVGDPLVLLRPVFVAPRPGAAPGADGVAPAPRPWWRRSGWRPVPPGGGLSVIGDCVTPRRIGHAIAEGYRNGANRLMQGTT